MMICKKRTKIEIRSGKEYLYKTFQLNPAPNFISTLSDGRYIDANDSGLRMLGYSREELIGRTVQELSVWNDPSQRCQYIPKLLKMGSLKDILLQIRTKHDEIKDVLWSSQVIIVNGERVMLSLLYDVTERKKEVDALRLSEQRLADIIEFLPDPTFAIDIQGRVIAWNRAVEAMTGVKKDEMLGKGNYEHALPFYGKRRPTLINLVLNPDRKLENKYDNLIRDDGCTIIAETWICFNEKDACLWGKASLLYDNMGNIVGAIESVRDITDRKLLELAIRKREADLEVKARELEDMNTALRVLLKHRENDRKEIEEKIIANIKLLISPNLEQLKYNLKDKTNHQYFNVIESNLNNIVSPFAKALSMKYSDLTNREIQVANLISEDKSTKEIANFLNISNSAVNMYRYRVRQKLGINNRQNLRAFLSNLT